MKNHRPSIIISMELLLDNMKNQEKIKIGRIFELLSGKGYATLLVMFSLPFCLPLQIPGFSTPFGIILAFLGLRVAFARKLWWPHWILEKEFSTKHVKLFAEKTIQIAQKLSKILRPRLLIFVHNPLACRLHGLLIFYLSILLALPLPIPFSNMLAAIPILLIGLGLLEDDGTAILLGYTFALACSLAFFGLYLMGRAQFGL